MTIEATPVRRFAVVGDPVAHSKSPRMHAAAFRALGLPHTYEAVRVTAEELPRIVAELREGTWHGLNVTVPHKQAVAELVDALDPSARAIGAVNTLVRGPSGGIVGRNSDVPALVAELRLLASDRDAAAWAERDALVIGSGGAARAVVLALGVIGVRRITVRARDVAKAQALEMILPQAGCPALVSVEGLAADPRRDAEFGAIVQATSAGMEGADPGEAVSGAVEWDALPKEAVALDVVYAPPETPFLRAAHARGMRAANGLGMLTGQGALAFEWWLGVPAPRDAMRAALTS